MSYLDDLLYPKPERDDEADQPAERTPLDELTEQHGFDAVYAALQGMVADAQEERP